MEKCTIETPPHECECDDCDNYGEVFDVLYSDKGLTDTLENYISLVLGETKLSRKEAIKYILQIEDSGEITITA